MQNKEIINLADRWSELAEIPTMDFYARKLAEQTANWLYEVAGLSEEVFCPTCKKKMDTLEDKKWVAELGECAICEKVRADLYDFVKEETWSENL